MATQSLIWSALPNGLAADGSSLRVSVLLSPRLHAGTDPQKLSSFFPDWHDWPATLAGATIDVRYGSTMVSVPVSQVADETEPRGHLARPARLAPTGSRCSRPDLFVEGFTFRDLTHHTVLSYDTGGVHGAREAALLEAGRERRRPHARRLGVSPTPEWGSVVEAVATLDRRFHDRGTGAAQPAGDVRGVHALGAEARSPRRRRARPPATLPHAALDTRR
jgi:hypothetical protein